MVILLNMNNFDNIVVHRKVALLREKIEEQRKILLELIEQWYHLRYVVQPKIMFEYDKIFGDLESELEEKAKLCSQMERKVELFFVKINRGMKITRKLWELIDKSIKDNKDEYDNFGKVRTNSHPFPFVFQTHSINNENLQNEICRMYRQLVKKLHPDVAGENEFFKKFWISIQDAYKERNYSKIRIFYKLLNNDLAGLEIDDEIIKKLEDELKDLKLMVNIEKRIIERMLNSEPFIFEKNLKNSYWIEQHREELKKKIHLLDRQIDFNRRLLKKIEENIEDELE